MSDQQIVDLFDSTNITLAELSRISGRSVPALKKLLMGAA
jgi:predicted HTH domain antitoxin